MDKLWIYSSRTQSARETVDNRLFPQTPQPNFRGLILGSFIF